MLERHDYVVMFLNGVRYLQKAPIHYWMVVATYKIFGQTEFALASYPSFRFCLRFSHQARDSSTASFSLPLLLRAPSRFNISSVNSA